MPLASAWQPVTPSVAVQPVCSFQQADMHMSEWISICRPLAIPPPQIQFFFFVMHNISPSLTPRLSPGPESVSNIFYQSVRTVSAVPSV
jgi:hypothetical protein